MNLKNKKVLVVGLGVSGWAAVRFLKKKGAHVAVTDQRKDFSPKLLKGLECHLGFHHPKVFSKRDLIVVSPGVPSNLPGLKVARREKTPVLGEFGLAALFLKTPMIAVTGTNGKSTTVTLIHHLLRRAGKKVALAGNIGKPLMEVVMENKRLDWVVAEVSSYQLDTVSHFHPRVSVLLNVTPDHLDRYPSFRAYGESKLKIMKEQKANDLVIYNDKDPFLKKSVKRSRVSKTGIWSKKLFCLGKTIYRQGSVLEKYSLKKVSLEGEHNAENMMASIEAARFSKISPESIQASLESFRGLPHRTQFVREYRGVRYYDDSKGTNVDAVVKSLAGFKDKKVVLIAGGRDKGGSYQSLKKMAAKKVKVLVTIGESRKKIARELKSTVSVVEAVTLQRAVPMAAAKSMSGDVVLLSPACSSFDQFKDYKERGDLFQKYVRALH